MDFQVDWAYSCTIAGVSILTVFILLVVLIWIISLQGFILKMFSCKKNKETAPVVEDKNAEGSPSEAEMAAIAMALELHYNSHDEVPEMLEIRSGQSAESPWCARNLCMNRLK